MWRTGPSLSLETLVVLKAPSALKGHEPHFPSGARMSCKSQQCPIPDKHPLLWRDPSCSHCPELAETLGDPILPPWPQQLHGEVTTSPKTSSLWDRLLSQHLCSKLPLGKGPRGRLDWGENWCC